MLDITTSFALISGLCAVFSALSSYKSSSTAKQALNLQKNVFLRKNEISSISLLIRNLQVFKLLANIKPLEMSDDKFNTIPSLIQEIKDSISELKSTGDRILSGKIVEWEQTECNSASIKDLLIHPNGTVFIKVSEHPNTLKSSIDGLTEIYEELLIK